MSLPRRNLKQELEYYAYKHPTIWSTCKATLCILSTPLCCCLCCCCWLGYCDSNGRHKGPYRRSKGASIDTVHWQRKVHALKRRQSLSIEATTSLIAKIRKKKVSDQETCLLFNKIPPEIREMIYEYALVETGAIQWGLERDWEYQFTVLKAVSCLPTTGDPTNIEYGWEHTKCGSSGGALLRTCRRIYTEAISTLYTRTQFRFTDAASLHAFAAITPASRLREIRSLRMDWSSWFSFKDHHAVVRFQCWENLRVVYIADDPFVPGPPDPFQSIVAKMESSTNCVFYLLNYGKPPNLRTSDRAPTYRRKLLSYKYVDPKKDPNWREAEWCMVD
ncbi:hypothetical protein IQ06DRAFT_293166 [Phaeosphaeriaceae sp. SRC1lsM3a]|nr:hypothetical protein IQ06DRAFT_293166 [Stagonospora sp. SRC1lsM3a]